MQLREQFERIRWASKNPKKVIKKIPKKLMTKKEELASRHRKIKIELDENDVYTEVANGLFWSSMISATIALLSFCILLNGLDEKYSSKAPVINPAVELKVNMSSIAAFLSSATFLITITGHHALRELILTYREDLSRQAQEDRKKLEDAWKDEDV